MTWDELRQRYAQRLELELGKTGRSLKYGLATLTPVMEWLAEKEQGPDSLADEAAVQQLFTDYLTELGPAPKLPNAPYSRKLSGARALLWEKFRPEPVKAEVEVGELEDDAADEAAAPPTAPSAPPAPPARIARAAHPTPPSPKEATMPRRPEPDDEIFEDEQEPEDSAEDPEEVAPSRRQPKTRVQYVMPVPAARQAARPKAAPAGNKLIPRSEKIRIYKRGGGGKRVLLGDYTTEDVGNLSLNSFIKEYIDPEYSDSSGRTTYEATGVDPVNDRDRGATSSVTIESAPQNGNASPVDQVRDAMTLITELQELSEQKTSSHRDMLAEAQRKAAGGGDMSQLMMLMMMEKLMAPKNDTAELVKLIERLNPTVKTVDAAPVHVPAPIQQLPQMMWQPPPPAPPPAPNALDKLMEVAIAKMLQPPPSFIEQMQQMKMMHDMLAGGAPPPPREIGALDGSIANFEKMVAVVKTLSPQLNTGGMLSNLLTPEVGKALAGALPSMLEAAQKKALPAPVPAPAPVQQRPVAPAAPTIHPLVVEKVTALRLAQTQPVQVQATVDLVQAMYLNGFGPQMEPVLASLLNSDIAPARQVLASILADARPELATPEFVDAAITHLIVQAGGTPPDSLTRKTAASPPERPDAQVIPIERAAVAAAAAPVAAPPAVPPLPDNPTPDEVAHHEKLAAQATAEAKAVAEQAQALAVTPPTAPAPAQALAVVAENGVQPHEQVDMLERIETPRSARPTAR